MTIQQAKNRIEASIASANEVIAQFIIAEVEPFIPVDKGTLRASAAIDRKNNEVVISYGQGLRYAKVQYNENLRHLGKRGEYMPIRTIRAGSYSSAYSFARRNGLLTKSRAKWFDSIRDAGRQRRLAAIYARAARRKL